MISVKTFLGFFCIMVLLLGISAQECFPSKATLCTSSISPTTSQSQLSKWETRIIPSTLTTATTTFTSIPIARAEDEAKSPTPKTPMLTARDYRRRRGGGSKMPTAIIVLIPLIVGIVCAVVCCALFGGKKTHAGEVQQQQRNGNGVDVEALGHRGVNVSVREPPRAVTVGRQGRVSGPPRYENEYVNEIRYGHGGGNDNRREDAPPPYTAT
ncbi:hypothetical protein BDW74DRAFT_49921 [Aspergillus multicolor]|uniref:uncharacterized protein n=1 Tax=Aspergillus multicolor TaxID=41759 RepID=UPI003CCC9CF7